MIGMSDAREPARQFLQAWGAGDAPALAAVLSEDCSLRLWGTPGLEAYRPRDVLVARLLDEWHAWPDPALQEFTVLAEGARVAVEFRIQATEGDRYVEHNRAAFLTVQDGQITLIDLYCPAPAPSARRKGWIAPATLSPADLDRLFATLPASFDIRDWLPPKVAGYRGLDHWEGGSGDTHPGSNDVGGTHWTAAEADARIATLIESYRARDTGFIWYVSSYDTPPDLAERLERHGLVHAGDQAIMARIGLDDLDIPTNPDLVVEVLDGSDEAAIEDMARLIGRCFNWTETQIAERLPAFVQRITDPEVRENDRAYVAHLAGVLVAQAHLELRGGIAYLGGAATLPEYRGRRIYSTLLRRRLADAHAAGYHIAAIHAEPMSRRIVVRYGFQEYARNRLYVWMPVIDMDVVRALVPDE